MASIDQTGSDSFNIEWANKDSDAKGFTIKDSAGVAIDISTFSFIMTVNSEKSPTDLTNEQFTISGTIVDGPNGKVSFEPLTSDTDITPGKYFYDIEQTDGSEVKTLVKGVVTITQGITDP